MVGCVHTSPSIVQQSAVVWQTETIERDMVIEAAFARAKQLLLDGLEDNSVSALAEQQVWTEELPPAVVLDIDETVLDNGEFLVELETAKLTFSEDRWAEWVERRAAPALPGAREFIAFARRHEVQVVFVSNRMRAQEAATIDNLSSVLGYRVSPDDLLLRSSETNRSKQSRREALSSRYRVILSIGDDYNDFVDHTRCRKDPSGDSCRNPYWVVIPNATYGSWLD